MTLRIALAGNPNSGKTTLFNALTGSNQYVGNWPGVTVEKKEGPLLSHEDVILTDLPGIYSLSPYTPEEVVARNYLINERPDAILNIIDGSNLERNLYLTTQLLEIGIPVVVAINMMDIVEKNGDKINMEELGRQLDATVMPISALKEKGLQDVANAAIQAASTKHKPQHIFTGPVEHTLAHIEEATIHEMPKEQQRWYAIKIFERDPKVMEELEIPKITAAHIEGDIKSCEEQLDDDAESIIINERYLYISRILTSSYKKKNLGGLTTSDKIDAVVTNRIMALPIFAVVMFLVYYISVTTVGSVATDWANDGVFGEGWHFLGRGTAQYEEVMALYARDSVWTPEVRQEVSRAANAHITGAAEIEEAMRNADFAAFEEAYGFYGPELDAEGFSITEPVEAALASEDVPDPSNYGTWVPGIPVLVENGLDRIGVAGWMKGLILDGIIGGVGSVLGFVPQMLVLFFMLSFLEACGYMSRIAFVMDRVFRKFGLSGKSFIPMLVGTGCSVPGIMASRTIESEADRRMTIMTTSFMPCGAKLPIIALIAAALFGGVWWVAPSAYFIGIAAIVISGIILKKTKMFGGDPAPFIMELPAYHMPTLKNLWRSTWDRGWSFIKKAGTVILLASILIWAGSVFGLVNGSWTFDPEMPLESSVLGIIGGGIRWLFAPLGFGNIKATVATIMGLVAKEQIVAVFGVLDFEGMTPLIAYSFLVFNLLCAPCFAAMGAIRREMSNPKWTAFALLYQTGLAYAVALMIYQFGSALQGNTNPIGLVFAVITLIVFVYLLVRPPYAKRLQKRTQFT